MEPRKLGLPLEYQVMPEFFDAHNVLEDTLEKNAVLENLLGQHKVKTVLDLTCGTGSQVFYLTERGYCVTGADFSPGLLEIARDRATKEGLDIDFIDADMRTLKAGEFEAAITMFNAVGHLTRTDFEKAIRNIANNLIVGGIYIFDIFNLQAMSEQVVAGLEMDMTKHVSNTSIRNIQHSTLNKQNGLLTSYDQYTIQRGTGAPEKIEHKFTLQIYTAEQLRKMLENNGFEVLSHCGMDGLEFLENKTPNILTVARKH